MASRVAEVAGSLVLVAGMAALAMALAVGPPMPSSEIGPVVHEVPPSAGRAFEDDRTARLALAQFPLPLKDRKDDADNSQLIGSVQIELARHGLDPGPADGVGTPKLRDAIAAYQRQMGLEVTGEPTRNLLDHLSLTEPLRRATASKKTGEMQKLVASVQKRLAHLGYAAGKPIGVVTGETREAIARFERDTGLPVTGEVTVLLVQRLNRYDSAPL